jgi:hypothetical protein
VSLGGSGSSGGGGNVSVTNSGAISTNAANSIAIFAQSVAAVAAAMAAIRVVLSRSAATVIDDPGGVVTVSNTGTLSTSGADSQGILAQSIGGGGGNGGTSGGTFSFGGTGGGGGTGGNVTVSNGGSITLGVNSVGIQAQSVGGGGGKAATRLRSRQAYSALQWVVAVVRVALVVR